MDDLIFDKDYTGPRWTYGLRSRPAATGAIPRGFIIHSDREHPAFNFGTLDYPRPLTRDEVYRYELTLVDSPGIRNAAPALYAEVKLALLVAGVDISDIPDDAPEDFEFPLHIDNVKRLAKVILTAEKSEGTVEKAA